MGFAIGGAIVASGLLSSQASGNAAQAQENAANQASATSQAQYNQTRQDNAPWVAAGSNALGQLTQQMPNLSRSFTMNDFQADPGYQFNLQQGQQAIQASAAARGLLNSTNTMASMANYTQGQASNEFNNAYNRFTTNQNQRYNMLAGVANAGQVANAQVGAAGANAANNISADQIGAGNAAAAGQIGQANALTNAAGTGMNSWMNMQMMNRFAPAGPGGAGGPGYGDSAGGTTGGNYGASIVE